MIVDLERNDLSRVCEPGSVRWPELMAERELAGVTHLVSTVEGTLREDATLAELLAATFPGGSVTGAPKIAALDEIARLEPVGRGASMGALGVVRGNGDLELALTIRTFAVAEGRIHLWVGGGIVWDSEPEAEIEESWTKARPLLAAIGAPVEASEWRDDAARRRRLGPRRRRPGRAGAARRRRGAAARPGGVRDAARLRRHAVPASRSTSTRLATSAERLGLPAVDAARARGPRREALAAAGAPDAVLRLFWTPSPTALALVSDVPDHLDALRGRAAQRLDLAPRHPRRARRGCSRASSRRATPSTWPPRRRRSAAAPTTRVFVDRDGIVLEGPTTNVWWRSGQTLFTPSLDLGILAGVTRAVAARARARRWLRRRARGTFQLERLDGAEEAFTSSSVREVMPVDRARRQARSAAARPPTSCRRAAGEAAEATLDAWRERQGPARRDGALERRARARADRVGLRRSQRRRRDQGRLGAQAALRAGVTTPFLRGPAPARRVVRRSSPSCAGACRRRGCRSSGPQCSPRRSRAPSTVQVVRRSRPALERPRASSSPARSRSRRRCSRSAAASSPPTTAPSTSRSGRTSTASRARRSTSAAART